MMMKRLLMMMSLSLAVLLTGCGNGGSSTTQVTRVITDPGATGNNTGGSGSNGTGNDVNFDLASDVFMPLYASPVWHYDASSTPVTLGSSVMVSGASIRPLVRGSERTEYFKSSAGSVAFAGMKVRLVDGDAPVDVDVVMSAFKDILQNAQINVANAQYKLNSPAAITVLGVPNVPATPVNFSITGTAKSLGNKMIDTAQFGALPAAGINVSIKLGDGSVSWLGFVYLVEAQYPALKPIFDTISTDLWFAPGVGIVQRTEGATTYSMTQAEGVEAPLVFHYGKGTALAAIPAQQIQLDGQVLTDSNWTAQINYRTSAQNWLDVNFDGTGSWRAAITQDLPAGLHVAVVRLTQGNVSRDVTVSVLVD